MGVIVNEVVHELMKNVRRLFSRVGRGGGAICLTMPKYILLSFKKVEKHTIWPAKGARAHLPLILPCGRPCEWHNTIANIFCISDPIVIPKAVVAKSLTPFPPRPWRHICTNSIYKSNLLELKITNLFDL